MSELYRKAAEFRKQLLARDAAAASDLTEAYGQTWDYLSAQLAALEEEAAEARKDGVEVSQSWLLRQERYRTLLADTEEQLRGIAEYASERVQQEQAAAIAAAQADAGALMSAAIAEAPEAVKAAVAFNRLPAGALESLVGFASDGTPLRALFDELGTGASAAIRRELVLGISSGRNPKVTARAIQGELGGDLVRARRIARTETLRAYRETTRRTYEENADVIPRWRWTAAKQARTCPACLAMDGTEFPVAQSLEAHPNCRCTMVPVTKYTRPRETGAEWLAKQPADVQERVLGPGGYKLYAAVEVELRDFAGRKESAEWGAMRHTHSLKAAKAAAGDRRRAETIRNAEKDIAPVVNREIGVGIAWDGTELFRQQGKLGERTRLRFTTEQCAALKDNVMTHNHFNGTSFTDDDLRFAINHDVREVRATGFNDLGEHLSFVMRRPEGGWPKSAGHATDEWQAIRTRRWNKNVGRMSRREITLKEFNRELLHEVMIDAAEKIGFEYERIKHDE